MAVIFAHKPQTSRTNPLPVGDSGGAVTFKEDNEYCILGVISTPNYYPRLGFLATRKWLNKKVSLNISDTT
ncbi:hypothetical protein [bacterium endosymbiont of Bathymodiolus sp. 5 South]|nr:hypothetical protein [bacterium endosymbiont of Bathymodiolus sp. 5 South]CAC9640177.1 hypothetical protein [uncultured Gammaproteobacteria bacterium]CAC9648401.1 hypothetical protein [uncultured Gammaproteobacteria bacterium]SHN93507.1 hypothetical protein BCLUESOX_678 [bacterium endosymbiont of Bathymodiolus sp. 5 South]SSC08379.1 hypothetical protein BTURTLESOX_1219 [bacterium endosymbiont of Bathymodiolus sp. 5 South]VVH55314.1 hypothetical protein BSPCLSOX_2051 [uncultured Gammaproteob